MVAAAAARHPVDHRIRGSRRIPVAGAAAGTGALWREHDGTRARPARVGGFGIAAAVREGVLLSDEEVQLAWRLQAAGIPVRYDSRIVVRASDPGVAPDARPGCCRAFTGRACPPCARADSLDDAPSVWRELPRRLAVAASAGAIRPASARTVTLLVACRWRLAYAAGFVRAALGARAVGASSCRAALSLGGSDAKFR